MVKQLRLKNLTQIGSDVYHEGIYNEDYLPPAIKNDPSLVEEINAPKGEVTEFKNSLKTQKIEIGSPQTNTEKNSFKTSKPVVLEAKVNQVSSEEADDKPKLNINQATIDDLANFDGITVLTAQKVIEERNKKEFTDFADLDKRVPLKGNRKWDNISEDLTV